MFEPCFDGPDCDSDGLIDSSPVANEWSGYSSSAFFAPCTQTANIPVNGTTSVNGVGITSISTGDVQLLPFSHTSCGLYTTSANALWVGQNTTWNVVLNFDQPVNNLVVVIVGTGATSNEAFNFLSNGGTVSIADLGSCNSMISGAQIISGQSSNPATGGGGEFMITAPTAFTQLTMYGPGGQSGSTIGLCETSIIPLCVDPDYDGDQVCDEEDLDDDNDGIPDIIESGLSETCPSMGSTEFPNYDYTTCSDITGGKLFSNIGFFQGVAIDMTITDLTDGSISCGSAQGCTTGDMGFTIDNTDGGTTADIRFYEAGTSNLININWAVFLDDLDAVEGIAVDTSNLFSYTLNSSNGMTISYFSDKINFDSNSDSQDELLLYFVNVQEISIEFTHTTINRDVCFSSLSGYIPNNPDCVLEKIVGIDTDNDGIDNHRDLDSDNDGIFDVDEAGHSAVDSDDDGRIDGVPAAFGSNGLYDLLETVADNGVLNYLLSDSETVKDSIYDAYEVDADADGCPDAIEGGGSFVQADLTIDSSLSGGVDTLGIPLVASGGQSVGNSADASINGCLEICDNGVDDDGDGLTDCNDPDCIPIVTYDINCTSDTTIALTVSGGTQPYSYSWADWVEPDAHWTFEDTTLDVSGNAHHEQLAQRIGTPVFDNSSIEGATSLSLDGATYLRYSENGSFMEVALTEWAISFWMNPSNLSGTQYIFDEGGATNGIAVRLNGNVLEFATRDGGSGGQVNAGTHTVPNDGNWHHVAAVYAGDSIRLYLDGIAGSASYTGYAGGEISAHSGNGGIGQLDGGSAFGGGSGSFYTGFLDDFKYFVGNSPSQGQIIEMARNDGNRYNLSNSGYYYVTVSSSGCTTIDTIPVRCSKAITTNLFLAAKVLNR